jgi:hypothetical protein
LPLHVGSDFIRWPVVRNITRRSDQRQYCGLAQGSAGLKTVQPVKKNVPMLILIGADRYRSLLAHLKNAFGDLFHHLGVNGPSPFCRNVNSID